MSSQGIEHWEWAQSQSEKLPTRQKTSDRIIDSETESVWSQGFL